MSSREHLRYRILYDVTDGFVIFIAIIYSLNITTNIVKATSQIHIKGVPYNQQMLYCQLKGPQTYDIPLLSHQDESYHISAP